MREYLCVVQESAFGTPVHTPNTGTPYTYNANATTPNVFYVRLDGGNAFTARPMPVMVAVPFGGGVAVDAFRVSDKTEIKGRLTCKAYAGAGLAAGTPGLAGFLVEWAMSQVNAAQTAPWTTTEPPGDLASCTIYHAVAYGTPTAWATPYRIRAYYGGKVDGLDIDVSEDGTIATISLDITFASVAAVDPTPTVFPAPTEAQLPINPYVFTQSSMTVGAARTTYSSAKLSVKNAIARRFWANKYIQLQRLCGRQTTLTAQNFLNQVPFSGATGDERALYEAVTVETASFELLNTYHEILITLNTANVVTQVSDSLDLNNLYLQTITVNNQWDSAASPSDAAYWRDLSITLTDEKLQRINAGRFSVAGPGARRPLPIPRSRPIDVLELGRRIRTSGQRQGPCAWPRQGRRADEARLAPSRSSTASPKSAPRTSTPRPWNQVGRGRACDLSSPAEPTREAPNSGGHSTP